MGNLWLIGMMGAGKTSVGRRVADRLGIEFVDIDARIAARLGCSIGELWGTRGEAAFRDMEAVQVTALAGTGPAVIATGGGVVLRADNIDRMRDSGTVVWLTAAPATLWGRLGVGEGRPLLQGEGLSRVGDLLGERHPLYATAAHATVSTDGRSPEEISEEVAALWTDT